MTDEQCDKIIEMLGILRDQLALIVWLLIMMLGVLTSIGIALWGVGTWWR